MPASATAETMPPAGTSLTRETAVPGLAPATADDTAVYLDQQGQVMSQSGATPEAATDGAHAMFGACTPYSGKDDPHYSSGRNHVDVDVDGKWDSGEKPYNQARVVCAVF